MWSGPMALDALWAGYVLVFAVTTAVCLGALGWLDRVEDRDTRLGFAGLLATTGLWSLCQVGYLAAPTRQLQHASYLAGLVVGFATVGAWLWLCSAYTGRRLHRDPTVRLAALGLFLAVVAVKLTNPIHGGYYTVTEATVPFAHLQIVHEPLHWATMGLAYALAAVGFFMLFELFYETDFAVGPLAAVVGLTGLPVVIEVGAVASDTVLELPYASIGVAVFAVGVLSVTIEQFQTVQLAGESDDPVIVLTDDGAIRDYNRIAGEHFPRLRAPESVGRPLVDVLPTLAASLDGDGVVEIVDDGERRTYQATRNPFSTDHAGLGRLITLAEVTERERYRRELERQNERLEEFASVASHDLRNPLTIARGRIDLLRERRDDPDLETASAALDRMEALVDDVLALARQGQRIDETEPVSLSAVVADCWAMVETGDAKLVVTDDLVLRADRDRLRQLLENLFRNAIEHGGPGVTVRVEALPEGGFAVADDGPGIPAASREEVFESGYTTNPEGTGFGLAIVSEVVAAHGWHVTVTESADGGARFEIRSGSR